VGDTPNTHDLLTGSDSFGRAVPGTFDTTCTNWTSNAATGSAMVGHRRSAIDAGGQGTAVSKGATEGIDDQLVQGRQLVETMPVIVVQRLRTDPSALAEWHQLKRVTLKGVPGSNEPAARVANRPAWGSARRIDRIIVVRPWEARMSVVTVSPKFQVVIPREIREALGLAPGQKVQALQYNDRVEFIPVRSAREMRGFLRGIATSVPRERDRK